MNKPLWKSVSWNFWLRYIWTWPFFPHFPSLFYYVFYDVICQMISELYRLYVWCSVCYIKYYITSECPTHSTVKQGKGKVRMLEIYYSLTLFINNFCRYVGEVSILLLFLWVSSHLLFLCLHVIPDWLCNVEIRTLLGPNHLLQDSLFLFFLIRMVIFGCLGCCCLCCRIHLGWIRHLPKGTALWKRI